MSLLNLVYSNIPPGCSLLSGRGREKSDLPEPPFIQAKQLQLFQPFFIWLLLQTLDQLCCPSLDSLQHLNVLSWSEESVTGHWTLRCGKTSYHFTIFFPLVTSHLFKSSLIETEHFTTRKHLAKSLTNLLSVICNYFQFVASQLYLCMLNTKSCLHINF